MARTQKAFFIDKKFGDFIIATTDVPKPGPGEVLIKVLSTSLNPVDWKIQKHDIFVECYPAILGSDVAGDIEEIGEGVMKFKKGDRVYASNYLPFTYSRRHWVNHHNHAASAKVNSIIEEQAFSNTLLHSLPLLPGQV